MAPCDGQFLTQLYLVPKKDGSSRPVVNLKALNKFITRNKFKIEGAHLLRDLFINRPKGCLLLCDHGSTRSEIAQVQLAGTDVRVSMPVLWPQQCPSSVYKAAEAHNSVAASEGPPSDIVPGRHVADGSVQSRIEDIREVSPTVPAVVGVQNELGQICSLQHSIPWVHGEISGDVHVTTKGESGQNQSGLQGHAETAFHHSARVISEDWASDSNSSGHSTSPFVLSSASTAEE